MRAASEEVTVNSSDKPGRKLRLTEREEEALKLLASGLPVKELAGQLGIAVHTANRHLQHIYHKLHARNRIDAVRCYERQFRSQRKRPMRSA